MVGMAGLVLVTGTFVTGSGPHGGDEAADRLPFAITTVARVHSVAVWVLLAVVLVVLVGLERGDADEAARGAGRALAVLVLAQGALGYLQYVTGVPEILVGGHVLGSVLVWVAALRFHLALTQPVPVPAARPAVTPVAEPVAG
jgi:heme A synthase